MRKTTRHSCGNRNCKKKNTAFAYYSHSLARYNGTGVGNGTGAPGLLPVKKEGGDRVKEGRRNHTKCLK